jgi:hypothetical protein
VPPDSVRCTTGHVRCTRGLQPKLITFGNFQRRLRYNSPDCPVYTGHVRCSKEEPPPELASLGISLQPLRYNSPDCPVYTGLSGATAGQRLFRRQRLPATHLMRALRAQRSDTSILAHRTIYSACPVRHRTSRRAQKTELQRLEPNGIGDVVVAPDMSGVHRTVRCAIDRQPSPTVKFGGWGYKYPNHPHIQVIQVFHFSTTYKSSSIQF